MLLLNSFRGIAQLNANFSVDRSGGCSPLAVSFTNTTTGASSNASYKWDFGNGNTATTANPGAIFINEQTYTVTLTVEDGTQTSSKTQTITVYKKPVIDFSASVQKGCIPFPVTFSSNSQAGSGSIASYYWDFGDGSTQPTTGNSVQHNYNLVQKSTVNLTVTNSYGCYSTLTKKDIVENLPALTAGFAADKTIICRETDPVLFTNTSTGPGTLSYIWDFGEGNTSTEKEPQHTFNKKGIYTVKLTVNSSEGCTATNTQTNYLNVATFKSDFNVPSLICTGQYVTFINNSSPATNTWSWEVNGQQAYYYNSNLYYYFNTAGTYNIKLKNTFGTCPDSITKQVDIKQSPTSQGFLADIKNLCGAPTDVAFKDTTPDAVKWEWNFDWYRSGPTSFVQAPVKNYTVKDEYNVGLIVTNTDGCKKEIHKYVNVRGTEVSIRYINPDDPWQSIHFCSGYRIGFASTSTVEIVSYNWNFGDGATSTDAKPVHVYNSPGTYKVSLTYTAKNGCTGTVYINNDFTIYPVPKIADIFASATTVCGNLPVTFSATVSPTTNNNVYYYWYFGDGNSTGLQYSPTVNHQYFKDSTYTVKLITSGNGYCFDTLTKTNFIKVLPPVPKISAITNTCDGMRNQVTFTQNSIKAESWTWDFGDGSTTTLTTDQPTISHTYAKTGSYKVVLTTTNGQCSVRDSGTAYVLLKQNPVLTASATEICPENNLKITVSNVELNPWGNNTYGHWIEKIEYKDGSNYQSGYWWWDYFQTTYERTFTNFERGKQDLRVIFRSHTPTAFCSDTTNYVPLKIKGPIAGYQVSNNVCYTDPVVFKDTSTSIGSTVQKWEWNFGDGQTRTITGTPNGNVSHTYSAPGYYWVSLKVSDNSGCTAATNTYIPPVKVSGPLAAFSASGTNVPLATTVNFYNTTNNSSGSGTSYKWQVNGVDFSTDHSPSYTFNQPGSYTVKLIATDPTSGCSSTATRVIEVTNFNAAFSFTSSLITPNSCPPALVRFTNTSQNSTSVKWDFGDGNTVEQVNHPTHIYEKAGKYIITLYVYGPNGLKGTFIDSVIIKQPEAIIKTSSTEGCIGHTVTLQAAASNTGMYIWDFGDGSILSTTDTFATHQYTTPGLYSPALLMKESAAGCTGATSLTDKINIRPDPTVTISPAQPFLCKGASVSLQANGGVLYEWLPATGLSNAAIANPVASPAQTSSYTVRVTDDIGCKNTGHTTITVIQPVDVSVTGNTSICAGESIQLKANGAEVYKWINNTAGLDNINIPNPVVTPPASGEYTVTGSDVHYCFTDTATIAIQVMPLPSVNAGADVEVWAGQPAPLNATGSNDVISYRWTPDIYLSCTSCNAPVSTPKATTTYTVSVRNQYGCKASDSVTVKTLCDESRVAIPNGFTPNGDGVNDVFIIKGISVVKHLIIFNRWGQKVYERSNFIAGDRSLCWDGNFNGYPAAEGTYVYFAEMECPAGGQFVRKGTVTLLR